MITTNYPFPVMVPSNLSRLLWDTTNIKAMAAQLVANQVEAHLDMISDAGAKEYGTYQEVADAVDSAKNTVEDYVEDLLTEFRDELYRQLKQVSIKTTAVMLKPNNEIDADVTVEIE